MGNWATSSCKLLRFQRLLELDHIHTTSIDDEELRACLTLLLGGQITPSLLWAAQVTW